jgi:hypothetical protein
MTSITHGEYLLESSHVEAALDVLIEGLVLDIARLVCSGESSSAEDTSASLADQALEHPGVQRILSPVLVALSLSSELRRAREHRDSIVSRLSALQQQPTRV